MCFTYSILGDWFMVYMGSFRMLLALDLCPNTTAALMLLWPISSSCLPSLCLCAAPRMFLHLRYLSRHQSLTLPLLKINNHNGMFIIAHFHTQPARNNHLCVCVRDRERGREGKRRNKRKSCRKTTGEEIKCGKWQNKENNSLRWKS